jgi:hypothetical protein
MYYSLDQKMKSSIKNVQELRLNESSQPKKGVFKQKAGGKEDCEWLIYEKGRAFDRIL